MNCKNKIKLKKVKSNVNNNLKLKQIKYIKMYYVNTNSLLFLKIIFLF